VDGRFAETEIAADKTAEILRFAQDDKNYILLDS
jgi:hypothetical protein